jgi:peptidoglycan/LPS O-acetylase OafA/YrhL
MAGYLQSVEKLLVSMRSRFTRQSRAEDKSRYIPTLDGWRAMAILLVVAHHAGTAFYGEHEYYDKSLTRFGTWGVPVFFALSGLLITKLLLEEFDVTGRISLKSFYIRRAFRILPPAAIFIFSLAAMGLLVSRTELASSLFFFRNYLPDSLGGIYTVHFWSLAVEEHFYLIWPGLLVWIGVRRGLPTAAAISVALALWMSGDYHYHLFARLFPNVTSEYRSDMRLDGLFCGCSMAFLLNRPASREWLRRYYSWWVGVLAAAAIAFCLKYQPYLATFWIDILIPLLMVGTTLHPGWAVSRVLDLKPVKWVGRISYSLYIWQQFFLVPSWEPKPFPMLQKWPLNLVLLLLCASASYYLIEKPLIRVGHKLAARFRPRVQEPSGVTWPAVAVRADS